MTPAEARFKSIVRILVYQGIHPTPTRINMALKRDRKYMNRLSGTECQWRRELVPGHVKGWTARAGTRDDKNVCRLHCCREGGALVSWSGPLYSPNPSTLELPLVCSNNHLELVRVISLPGMDGQFIAGSGVDMCTFCDEWRDQNKVAVAVRESLESAGLAQVGAPISFGEAEKYLDPSRLPLVEPGTILKGIGMPPGDFLTLRQAAAAVVVVVASVLFIMLMWPF